MLSLAMVAGGEAQAADVYAYVSKDVPSGTDAFVSVPVNNSIEVELATTGVTGSVIGVANSPEFAAGDFNAGPSFPVYYIRFVDGPAAGLWSSITANSETTFTIDNPAVAGLATLTGGDTIRVYKHHTVNSVFPTSLAGIAVDSGVSLLFYSSAPAINKAPGSGGALNFLNINVGGNIFGWGPSGARPLFPEEAFLIRNTSGSTLTYVATGIAPDHPVSYLFDGNVARDTAYGTGYPVNVTLNQSGFGGATQRSVLRQASTGLNEAPGSAGSSSFLDIVVGGGSVFGWGPSGDLVELAPNSAVVFRQPVTDAGGKSEAEIPY